MESLPSGIQYRHWPVDDAKACVLLAHGLAEHTGRYEHVAARFNEHGVAVVGPDHRGHGASPGARVYLKSFSEYLEPMQALRMDMVLVLETTAEQLLVSHKQN